MLTQSPWADPGPRLPSRASRFRDRVTVFASWDAAMLRFAKVGVVRARQHQREPFGEIGTRNLTEQRFLICLAMARYPCSRNCPSRFRFFRSASQNPRTRRRSHLRTSDTGFQLNSNAARISRSCSSVMPVGRVVGGSPRRYPHSRSARPVPAGRPGRTQSRCRTAIPQAVPPPASATAPVTGLPC